MACFFDHALLPGGWARDVRIEVADGAISAVTPDTEPAGAERIAGIALPGLPNLHCHAFQRGMAGLSERRGPAHDSFWTWREVMYRFLSALTPDDVEAIAAFTYMEMLEAGYTAVGEFHYLHHDIHGRPYADLGEMTARIANAARETGIGLTLLPCFYAYGGFRAAAPAHGQRRFINDPDRFLKLVARSREITRDVPDCVVGIAPHSLRAVTPKTLRDVDGAAPDGPIHIHAAEQTREVEDCVAALGARPVAWLLDNAGVDARWCLVHATHMDAGETQALAKSGAVAGLCPLTEANLGDGIFNAIDYLANDGRVGVGTDSNIQIDAAAELRQLEYSQRLKHRGRNLLADREGQSVGRILYEKTLAGGAQAMGRKIGKLEAGHRADIVVLDGAHPDLAAAREDLWLDAYVFAGGRRLVKDVVVGGTHAVRDRRHTGHDRIVRRYRDVLARLSQH
ncbi:MAG: formimidoylglutamate deiminase [Pseudorhodoplanes sp.]|nr:formimidoylglutamate deiminase [Pseudorhodoplanes sp.]